MNMPGFAADRALYRTTNRYFGGRRGHGANLGVVPALPSCGTCTWAFDSCIACLEKGGKWKTCLPCRVLTHCGGACDAHPGGNPDTDADLISLATCAKLCQGDETCMDFVCQ